MADGIVQTRGELLESYGNVKIFDGFPHKIYELRKQVLELDEQKFYRALVAAITGKGSLDDIAMAYPKVPKSFVETFNKKIIQEISLSESLEQFPTKQFYSILLENLKQLLKQSLPSLKQADVVAENVLDHSIGYGILAPLIHDPDLEEIMVNSSNFPVFVFHRKKGICKTNIVLEREDLLEKFVQKIARTVGKKFDAKNPLLDARLPDGSRANATFRVVSPLGISLTIRKFTEVPFSVIDLIENKTFSSEIAAFLWLMVEGLNIEPMNIIVTGGSGSGKTTTLNALSTFIRFSDRVITIEDTVELDLGARDNWIQLESKNTVGSEGNVTMDDLLKNSLRMRPDRIIVGEVRGEEAQTLFVAMDTGHQGSMGTLHSNSAREMLMRLQAKPMNVPESMLNLLNLVIVQYKMYDRIKGPIRRVAQVSELTRMDEKVLLSNVFEWNRQKDEIERTQVPSSIMEFLAEKTGLTKNDLKKEMTIRQRILEWMGKNNIRKNNEVEKVIQQYYLNPNIILEEVMKTI